VKYLVLLFALIVVVTGCAPVIGTHVHQFSHKDMQYIHCTIVAPEGRPDLGSKMLDVCRAVMIEPEGTRKNGNAH
jgi:hypothetical protein